MFDYIGYIIMGIGLLFMSFGVIGILQPQRNFYYRILVSCKIDTVGILTFSIGLAVRHGLTFFTGKVFLILIIMLILNPLVAHIVARSAYTGGYVPIDALENDGKQKAGSSK